MKKNQQKKTDPSNLDKPIEGAEQEFIFHIPPGVRFDDVYIDAQEVSQQLKKGKRAVANMRINGIISSTFLIKGKFYYFKQEIAGMMTANRVIGKNSLMKKMGFQSLISASTSLLSLLTFDM
jgi:hypothetical protein